MPGWGVASKAQDQANMVDTVGERLRQSGFRATHAAARRLLTTESVIMQCGYGSYKPESGDLDCVRCPGRNTSTAIRGATSAGACRCMHGHYRPVPTVLDCEPCAAETYRELNSGDALPCVPCPEGQTTLGTTGNWGCVCKSGTYITESGCQPCPAGSFCTTGGGGGPETCYVGSTSMEGSTSVEDCYCTDNATRLERVGGGYYCVPLKPGMRVDKSRRFLECLPGWRSEMVGSDLIACYLCAPGAYAHTLTEGSLLVDATTSQVKCTVCPRGTYSGPSRMVQGACTRCPPLQTTQNVGALSIHDCYCPPPLATNRKGQCEGCTERQYATPHDGCKDCPANSRVGAVRGTSVLDCLCDKGFQPSSSLVNASTACEPCPAGTYSATASHDRCSPCAAFGKTSKVVGGASLLSCNECLPGYTPAFQLWCVRSSKRLG